MNPLHVILVGNYGPDRQESMHRFATMVAGGLAERGISHELLAPSARVSRLAGTYRYSGIPKWLGYVDKFWFFPRELRRRAHSMQRTHRVVAHICDHSNAMYAAPLAGHGVPHLVTCHDLLAVRGALGEDTDCPATPSGVRLQKWILRSLAGAQHVACVSGYTRGDLLRLLPQRDPSSSSVVFNGLNHSYHVLAPAEIEQRLAAAGIATSRPFVLHVGSNLRRKNKPTVLHAVAQAGPAFTGDIVMAGPEPKPELLQLAAELGLGKRLRVVVKPDNRVLEALYNRAHAFLFPSRWEGFGWPIIEAQACGCPVIAGNQSSLPEVAGGAAELAGPDDHAAWGAALARLADHSHRQTLVDAGLRNVTRCDPRIMIDSYLALYEALLHSAPQR